MMVSVEEMRLFYIGCGLGFGFGAGFVVGVKLMIRLRAWENEP